MARRRRPLATWLVGALACWTAHVISVEDVIDGDTFRAELGVWPKVVVTETVRVLGVDTPEKGQKKYEEAKVFTKVWLSEGLVLVTVCRYDHFGRALGRVVKPATEGVLAMDLLQAGLGEVR